MRLRNERSAGGIYTAYLPLATHTCKK